MEIAAIEKNLSIIKPAEERIQGWRGVLIPIFNWEEESLREIRNLDVSDFIVSNPKVSDIPKLKGIEEKLKEIKRIAKVKQDERKDLFKHVESLKSDRLMLIEKTYDEISKLIEGTYMAIKRIANAEEDKIRIRQSDLQSFRSRLQSLYNQSLESWNLYTQSKVTEVYSDALDLVEVADLKQYLNDILWKHTEKAFVFKSPNMTELERKDEEKYAIYKEIFDKWDSKRLSSEFASLLMQTFSDFEIAKNQKEEALKMRQAEQIIQTQEIHEEAKIEEAIVAIEEKSFSFEPVFEKTRDLKKFWKINMEHTESTMMFIFKAFFANRKDCLSNYRGKDCWNINAVDMGNLLCLLKNKDVNFAPDNVIFEESEKI